MKKLALASVAVLCWLFASAMSATAAPVFFVGVDLYSAGASGQNVGGGYRYSSNVNDPGAFAQQFTPVSPAGAAQTRPISFMLQEGDNVFSFSVGNVGIGFPVNLAGPNAGLMLFFNDTGASFNPTGVTPVAGDLVIFGPPGAGFNSANPAAGTLVQDFRPGGGLAAYSGATSLLLDDRIITARFQVSNPPGQSPATNQLVINVTTIPEPMSLAVWGIVLVGAVGTRRLFRSPTPSSSARAA